MDRVSSWQLLFQACTAAAAATGATVAVLGYRKWMPESVGKRKIELAEQTLADFYQARDVIEWARFPYGHNETGRPRKLQAEESDDERGMRDSYYRTIQRLSRHADLFARLQARKYQAIAFFGSTARQPFEELASIHARVFAAAGNLVRYYKSEGDLPKRWPEWETTIGWLSVDGGGNEVHDTVAEELNALIARVEAHYGKWLLRQS